jgi:hypothetical protein
MNASTHALAILGNIAPVNQIEGAALLLRSASPASRRSRTSRNNRNDDDWL